MDHTSLRQALLDALLAVSGRTTTREFRRLAAWGTRALYRGDFPAGIALLDVLDLQLAVLRLGRCTVPYCENRESRGSGKRRPREASPPPGPTGGYRLCRTHRRLWKQGYLRIVGSPDAPSFFGQDGSRLTYRSG